MVGDSTPAEGRVEVLHNGTWGTVCDNGWDLVDATVVCRSLGYSRASNATCCGEFGQGSGEIFLNGVQCSGAEFSLYECQHDGIGVHDCTHEHDAGVICIDVGESALD